MVKHLFRRVGGDKQNTPTKDIPRIKDRGLYVPKCLLFGESTVLPFIHFSLPSLLPSLLPTFIVGCLMMGVTVRPVLSTTLPSSSKIKGIGFEGAVGLAVSTRVREGG